MIKVNYQDIIFRGARCPRRPLGRPRQLDDAHALALVFKLLLTGMQWRELDCTAHHVLRKMHDWTHDVASLMLPTRVHFATLTTATNQSIGRRRNGREEM